MASKLREAANIDPAQVNWARYFYTTEIGYVPERHTRDYRRDTNEARELYGIFTPLTEQDLDIMDKKRAERYSINIDTDFDPFTGLLFDSPTPMVPLDPFEDECRRELRGKLKSRVQFVFLGADPCTAAATELCQVDSLSLGEAARSVYVPPPPSPTEQEQALFLAACMRLFDGISYVPGASSN